MKLIPLTQGQFAKVDDSDFDSLSRFKWCVNKIGTDFYAMRNIPPDADGRRKKLYLHRHLMGNPPGFLVDHENHDTLDCQKSNLRIVTKIENGQNRKGPTIRCRSGVRGVSWSKAMNRWCAEIQVSKRRIRIGYFRHLQDAANAYAESNRTHFGAFGGGL